MWLEAARLEKPANAKAVLAKAKATLVSMGMQIVGEIERMNMIS